jgi:hypothetical protein
MQYRSMRTLDPRSRHHLWAGSYRVDLTQVKYDLVADRVNQLSDRWTTVPTEQRTVLRIEA